MEFKPADPISLCAFLIIVLGILIALFIATYKTSKNSVGKTVLFVLLWLGVCAVFVGSGLLESVPMPALPIFFLVANGAALFFALSPMGLNLALGLPIWTLVAFQGFRFFLELVLHEWSNQGTIPVTMTWTGQNFDIITGLFAILLAPVSVKRPRVAWIVNGFGLAMLLNVMRVAILSSPLPFAWNLLPPLQLAFHFPYFLIVPICIGGALAGHVILTRALLRGTNT